MELDEEKKPCTLFCDEFSIEKFKLSMTPAELCAFGDSAMLGSRVFGFYRVTVALYFFAVLCWSIGDSIANGNGAYWLIYLTHWTLALEIMYLILGAYVTLKNDNIRSEVKPDEPFANIPGVVLITWILMNVVYVCSFIVFLMYWLLVYDGDPQIIGIQTHGVNFLLMLIDVFFNGAPFRIMHFYMPVIYGGTWSIFSYLYWAAGGTDSSGNPYVYSAIDWSSAPGTAAIWLVFLVLVAVPVFHLIFWWWWYLGNVCSGENSKWRQSLIGKERGDEYGGV